MWSVYDRVCEAWDRPQLLRSASDEIIMTASVVLFVALALGVLFGAAYLADVVKFWLARRKNARLSSLGKE